MGEYSAIQKKDMYPSLIALQNTEREIAVKLREYKQAVRDYTRLADADDLPESRRCPYAQPYPFFSTNADGGMGVKDGSCCSDGKIGTTGRYPVMNTGPDGGPAKMPDRLDGYDITPGQNDLGSQTGSAKECVKACSRMPACKAVVTSGSGDSLTCHFKSVAGPSASSPGAAAYMMPEKRQCGGGGGGPFPSATISKPGQNISAASLETIGGSSQADCILKCTNDPRCVAGSVTVETGVCALKGQAGPLESSPGGDHPIDDGTNCNTWGCTCQGLANRFGVKPGMSFGCAPDPAQQAWTQSNCFAGQTTLGVQPGTTPGACGPPSASALSNTQSEASQATANQNGWNRASLCSSLASDYGIIPNVGYWGCAGGNDVIKNLWSSWDCDNETNTYNGKSVTEHGLASTFSGCDPTVHTSKVDSFILNSPKPCRDSEGKLVGNPDWCKSGTVGSCSQPPCQASGSTCPADHPYPFTLDGVEDAACCDKAPPPPVVSKSAASSKPTAAAAKTIAGLFKIKDIAGSKETVGLSGPGGSDAPKKPADTDNSSSGAANPTPSISTPPDTNPPTSGPFGAPTLDMRQSAPAFEGFETRPTSAQCPGRWKKCKEPPCRSGIGAERMKGAWEKVKKLNKELIDLVNTGQGQQGNAFDRGTGNMARTKANSAQFKQLSAELEEERKQIREAERLLVQTELEQDSGSIAIEMYKWKQWGYIVGIVVVLAIVVKVTIKGTAGTADLIACIAAALLFVFYTWKWFAGHLGWIKGYAKAAVDKASSADMAFL